MRTLVTGATSLLGNGIARELVARGHEVTVMQRGASGLNVAEVRGDIADTQAAKRACSNVDAVIHVAAKVSVVGDWSEFERVNVLGTANILAASRFAGVSRFVYVSSPSVAHSGDPLVGVDATPAEPEHARGHYAKSKAMAEQRVLEASSQSLSTVAIRPHLVWGPGDTQLVARIVDRARQGRLFLIGGGTALIDSTYIANAVTATLAALDRAQQLSGEAYVVSNGEPRTVAELLERICIASGVPGPEHSVPAPLARVAGALVERAWGQLNRDEDPPLTSFLAEQLSTAHWFDQRRTRDELQWSPHVSLSAGFDALARSRIH